MVNSFQMLACHLKCEQKLQFSFRYDWPGEKEKAKLDLQLANSGCLGCGEDNNVAQLGDVSGCHGDDADDVRLSW